MLAAAAGGGVPRCGGSAAGGGAGAPLRAGVTDRDGPGPWGQRKHKKEITYIVFIYEYIVHTSITHILVSNGGDGA